MSLFGMFKQETDIIYVFTILIHAKVICIRKLIVPH
jgi:hypothetical protein